MTYPFNDDPNSAFFAVFDGHGMNGEQVSEYAIWKVQEIMMLNCSMLPHKAEQCMIHAFEEGDKQLAKSPVAARVSGTAAVAVFVHGTTLVRAPRTPALPRDHSTHPLYFFYSRVPPLAVCAVGGQLRRLSRGARDRHHEPRRLEGAQRDGHPSF